MDTTVGARIVKPWHMPRDPLLARLRAAAAPRRSSASIRAGLLPWVPFWMALGIGGWFGLPFQPGLGLGVVLAAAGIAALLLIRVPPRVALAGRLSWGSSDCLRILGLATIFVILGVGLAGLRSALVAAPVLDFRFHGAVEGRVVGIDRSSRDRMRLTLDQIVLEDVRPEIVPERARISLVEADTLPIPGQRVMLTAHLGPPSGPAEPGGFDFRRMAWFERLGAIGYSRTPVMTVEPPGSGGALALHRLRMRLSSAISDSIGGQAGAVSAAMMTGDRSGISERTNEIMRGSNLYHIVSISGLHMSMLTAFVYAALRLGGAGIAGLVGLPCGKLHKLAAGGALVAAAFYHWLSGADVATTRSFIMVAVMLIAIVVDRRAISLRTVAVAGIIILSVTPEALVSPGFQMSFAATVALVLVAGPWQRFSPGLPWWLKPVVLLLVSSTVASLATSPIAAAHFGRVAHFGILANLLVVPVIGAIVMPAGAIAAVAGLVGLQDLPLWFMGVGTTWMLLVAETTAGVASATTMLPAPPRIMLPMLGVGACMVILAPIGTAFWGAAGIVLRRACGFACVLIASFAWITHQRPAVLISAEGDAVGIMTAQGRALSKPKGGAFAVAQWLEADGVAMTRQSAAEIALWTGEPGIRKAIWSTPHGDTEIVHLTGKGAENRAADACRSGVILVSNAALPDGLERRGCVVLDRSRLRGTGAVAIGADGANLRIVTAQEVDGDRPWWTASSRRQGASDVQ